MHFQIALSTLDSLKSVFNVFRTKPSLGAPETRRSLYETNGNPNCPTSQTDWIGVTEECYNAYKKDGSECRMEGPRH